MNNIRLNFYSISDDYIHYISKFDKHIAYNKNSKRPYIGIILEINKMLYFAPMFSPKSQHKRYKNNLTFFKIFGNRRKTDYLGLIRFSDMLPVPKGEISIINIKNVNKRYNALLDKQYNYINQKENKKQIKLKAKKLHDLVISEDSSKTTNFYKDLSCNFKLLEEKCVEYEKEKSTK